MLPITGAETRVVLLQMASDPQVPEKTGVQINGRKIVDCASVVLKDVLMRLAPLVLPVSELVQDPASKYFCFYSRCKWYCCCHYHFIVVVDVSFISTIVKKL